MRTGRTRCEILNVLTVLGLMLLSANPVFGAEVGGIWSEPATKDVGVVTGIKALEGLKVRGWISTYYNFNLNTPPNGTLIGGRLFDIRDQTFAVELAEVEFEKVPDRGKVGLKLDVAFGDTQDQIFDGVRAFHGVHSLIEETDRVFQHASVGYVVPVGRGLRLDIGKLVTHIGGETIEGIKNNNFSHAYFYSFAIPFQDTGLRLNYPWTDKFYTELYILNGWNTTIDNDDKKAIGPSFGWTVGPVSWYVNYLIGHDSDTRTGPIGSRSTTRALLDSQLFYTRGQLNLALNYDRGGQDDIPFGTTSEDVEWWGAAFWIRYKVKDRFEPSLRYEFYNDSDSFTVGAEAERFHAVTVTLNTKLGGPGTHLLVRPEFRWDKADKDVSIFRDDEGKPTDTQSTLGLNLVSYF